MIFNFVQYRTLKFAVLKIIKLIGMNLNTWLKRRESGLMPGLNDENFIIDRIYQAMKPYSTYDSNAGSMLNDEPDSILNMEFSPAGDVLASACRNNSILLFDANSSKRIHHIPMAHDGSVNEIQFLDNHLLATCSNDATIKLWDLRHLKKEVATLSGHSRAVQTIEYCKKEKILVSSAMHDSILIWDMNSLTGEGHILMRCEPEEGLMRCRITPEGDKLVLKSLSAYFVVIHDLDLTSLCRDLHGFQPRIYQSVQSASYHHLFSKSQRKNRLQLIADFPDDTGRYIVTSLQIHPKGHSFLSGSTNVWDEANWTCIHELIEGAKHDGLSEEHMKNENLDIQPYQNSKKLMYYIGDSSVGYPRWQSFKNPCFSNDGRIIASPFDNCVRLLGFSENCAKYPTYLKHGDQVREPRQLCLIKEIGSHEDTVVSTKFSPRELLLVTGCMSGRIVWNRPVI